MAGAYLDACRIYVLLLKAYPETVAFYGVNLFHDPRL
jgi:hypothetical protein